MTRLALTKEAAAYCGISSATFERRLVNDPDGPRLRPIRSLPLHYIMSA